MKTERHNKLIDILIGIALLLILTGALLKIWHNPIGTSILELGLFSYVFLSSYEIRRLKKIIAKSKKFVSPDELSD